MKDLTFSHISSLSVEDLVEIISSSASNLGPDSNGRHSGNDTAVNGEAKGNTNGDVNGVAGHNHHGSDAKSRLLDACRALIVMVSGPTEVLKNMALIDKHNLISLQIINHYQIASLVPTTGNISISDLANQCKIPCDVLTRILRQAMTYQVFCEPWKGYVAHTQTSQEIPRLAPLLSYQLEICLPSSLSLLEWLKQDKCSEADEGKFLAPFQIAHNTHDSWWTYAEKRPELIQNYGRYMALITKGGPHDVSHVVKGFAWEKLRSALVIDVGGADGYVGSTVAEANPLLTVLVQDNPGLKESADTRIPMSLKNRVIFTPHSFFEPQGAIGSYADVFLLRHILHDWNDAACVKILRHLTICMKPGARILVAEQVLNQPGTVNPGTERIMRALDMQMMVQFGGKERTLDDWEKLFSLADPALELVECVKPSGSADCLLELRMKSVDGA